MKLVVITPKKRDCGCFSSTVFSRNKKKDKSQISTFILIVNNHNFFRQEQCQQDCLFDVLQG